MKKGKGIASRILSMILAIAMVFTLVQFDAFAAQLKSAPTSIDSAEAWFWGGMKLSFSSDAAKEWLAAITDVTVNGTSYEKESSSYGVSDNTKYYVRDYKGTTDAGYILIGEGFENPGTCVIKADGYETLTMQLNKDDHSAKITGSSKPEQPETPGTDEDKPGTESKAVPSEIKKVESTFFNKAFRLIFTMNTDTDWVENITAISVNGIKYEEASSTSVDADSTKYYKNSNKGMAQDPYIEIGAGYGEVNPATCVISSKGYKDLTVELNKDNYSAKIVGSSEPENPGTGEDKPSDEKKVLPTAIKEVEKTFYDEAMKLIFSNATDIDWVTKITGVTVNGIEYEKTSLSGLVDKSTTKYYTYAKEKMGDDPYILLGLGYTGDNPATCVIKAEGYEDLTVKINKDDYSASIVGAKEDKPEEKPDADKKEAPQVTIEKIRDFNSDNYVISFKDSDDYVKELKQVLVNGTKSSEALNTNSLSGTKYYRDKENNKLYFSTISWGNDAPLQSGNVITLKSDTYKDLALKITIVGKDVSIAPDDGKGESYQLNVKLKGAFEAAVVGQKGYDGVTSASTSASINKNSDVAVYGALTEVGTNPSDDDWKLLKDSNITVNGNSNKSYVTISPEGSGMTGTYSVLGSDITLSGTPKKAGNYQVTVTVTDDQGRVATSNALPFNVYDTDTQLADRLKLEYCTKTQDGKYLYDMEPWTMSKFGGENETVTVPKDIKAWYGSHTSGTYGYLGYALIDSDKETTQTLIIPSGCDLTMVNMDVWSSVKIVVEKGAKLSLHDSVVEGIIEVQDGATFSMNYDSFNEEFLTGASICGQVRLLDGAILENSMIYSNSNYLANGEEVRYRSEPVVTTQGNVIVKGQVFIRGDEGVSSEEYPGQAGLSVTNGTLTLADGAVLAVYGGGNSSLTIYGGDAIKLDNATITGKGKLIAIGGAGFWGNGGNAVSGNGTISTDEAYIHGGISCKKEPGKTLTENVTLDKKVTRATLIEGVTWTTSEPEVPYWNSIIAPPDLTKYPVPEKHVHKLAVKDKKDATCTTDGYTGDEYCTECEEVTKKGEVIKATGHKVALQNVKKATCTKAGYTGDEVCTVCKETVKKGKEVKALGHSYGAWKVTKKATATKTGLQERICSRCNEKETKVILATGKVTTVKPFLVATAKAVGGKKIKVSWNKVTGATKYNVYWAYCDGKSKFKKVATVKSSQKLQFTHTTMKKNSPCKYYVVACKGNNTIVKSKEAHVVMSVSKYTNPKSVKVTKSSVSLKVKKTYQIKASMTLENSKKKVLTHTAKFRYYTNDKSIATVDKNGKITAKKKGSCKIYVLATNGVAKQVTVTVK